MSQIPVNINLPIPFSPPFIDEDVIAEVTDTLRSGWITTGPKVKALEELCQSVIGTEKALCVNSWTSGAMLVMKWLGIGAGDEVIIPAYTYAATALSVMHMGATPVMVDVHEDFTIAPQAIAAAITPKTKAVISVDFGGMPCRFDEIMQVLQSGLQPFTPANDIQAKFGRPVLISDAAHSLGAMYRGRAAALAADITVFSLHAVKNVTTAEGGVICINLPKPFDNEQVYAWMRLNAMNGQTKDAFTKTTTSSWRYDIVSDGLKINMPDVCAAIGLAQLRKYHNMLLPARKQVHASYINALQGKHWPILPVTQDEKRASSYHLFALRINGINEAQRDRIISLMNDAGVSTNVHFVPLPMLTLFKTKGFNIDDYPVAYNIYSNEISLPVYPQLTEEHCEYIIQQLEKAYNEVVS
jgi:Predicted pyridoxal phosphate-dependent enzyme apparently involved in regulation of cell wall biogenesis